MTVTPNVPPDDEPARSPDAILAKALEISQLAQPCGLRLPFDRQVAIALRVAGVKVRLDNDRGIAHVAPAYGRGE